MKTPMSALLPRRHSPAIVPAAPPRGRLPWLLSLALVTGCNDGGRGGGTVTPTDVTTSQPELQAIEYGRLVDVYGLRADPEGTTIALYERDVVIGLDIVDQRPAESPLPDAAVTYDFLGADPDTLQPRLFIPRDLTSEAFREAFAALDDRLRDVSPMRFGEGGPALPYSVVPRNAALRLRFSAPLGIDDAFFVSRDATGTVTGLRNTEAVQLLRIVADPEGANGFVPMPTRVVVRERSLVLDPVLLGGEALQYQAQINAAGLPASPDQVGANVRVALALAGPLAIPRLRVGANGLTGKNNSGYAAIVRDFRSGNATDSSSALARGFLRDPLPLRVVGELPMYLERVDTVNQFTQEVTIWKHGIRHELDRGDVLRFVRPGSGELIGSGDVVADPDDDRDSPEVQHVRVRIRRVPGLEAIDPRNLPGYPSGQTEREHWLVEFAPRAICVAEFTAGGAEGRDDPRNFLVFSPAPLPLAGVQPAANEFVSTQANAIVRFTKPVDMETVKWADTFFFAMRDLSTSTSIGQFVATVPNQAGGFGMDPGAFDLAKYRTPFLIAARVRDEDGSQTSLRLQPTAGFYLDDTMRNPPAGADHRYFLHLIANSPDGGIRDLAGNTLDLQGTTPDRANSVVIPFTVDTRMNGNEPLFGDNLAVSIVRRFASRDEDANPSYLRPEEVQAPGGPPLAAGYRLEDLFGGVVYIDGRLQARPGTRARIAADNRNQPTVVQQPTAPQPQTPLGWCPQTMFDATPAFTEAQRGSSPTGNLVGIPIQNPMNPSGARLQTLWREIDLNLSRTDPFDFNLDIEQMYWAPFVGGALQFDEFDQTSLWLGHSEYRPVPCVGDFSGLPSLPNSGLRAQFARNFVWNPQPAGGGQGIESQPSRHPAYVDAPLTIDPSTAVVEPTGANRYLPLPRFQKPYFVWRDETVVEQGCDSGVGSDLTPLPSATLTNAYAPYVTSPFAQGQGRQRIDVGGAGSGNIAFVNSYWNDATNYRLGSAATPDPFTGGLVGSIALPLLADFWTWCDSSALPVGDPYVALGSNGWQTSVTLQSNLRPNFRVFSGGRPPGAPQGGLCIGINDAAWVTAAGGWAPAPGGTASTPWVPTPVTTGADPIKGDNTFYWIMMDVVRRQSVATAGFVDLHDPHRVPLGFADPRLGPWFLPNGQPSLPDAVLPTFAYEFDPPLSRLPAGTSTVVQFRGADAVDPQPWYWTAWISTPNALFPANTAANPLFDPIARADLRPTAANFPLDPCKAVDAHIRKWDPRNGRNWWTHLYNRTVTGYVEDPNLLMDPAFLAATGAPGLTPRSIRYVNWRFLFGNNVDADPPTSPSIETFALTYRFVRTK